jgi:hypothetical protein
MLQSKSFVKKTKKGKVLKVRCRRQSLGRDISHQYGRNYREKQSVPSLHLPAHPCSSAC